MEYKVCDGSLCVGCALCADVCPNGALTAGEDKYGFIRPMIDPSLCVGCGACSSVCPANEAGAGRGAISVFAAYALDEGVRSKSSSGGVFRLLADDVIESGGVVAAVGFDGEFHAVYKIAEDSAALCELMGSKYTEARSGGIYKKVKKLLDEGRRVLFVGTACRVAALKNFCGERDGLLTVDLICHGVPTGRLLEKYLEGFGGVRSVSFRDKSLGWLEFSMRVEGEKTYRRSNFSDPYLRTFLNNAALRESCYDCRFKGDNYRSDITLGAFWGIYDKIPSMDDDGGTSAVVIRTPAGEAAFCRIKDKMKVARSTYSDLAEVNPSVEKSAKRHSDRQKCLDMIERGEPFDAIASEFGAPMPFRNVAAKRLKRKAEKILGKIKR